MEYTHVPAERLAIQQFQAERKEFTVTVEKNRSGAFLKIVEVTNGRKNIVIVPHSSAGEFMEKCAEALQAADAKLAEPA